MIKRKHFLIALLVLPMIVVFLAFSFVGEMMDFGYAQVDEDSYPASSPTGDLIDCGDQNCPDGCSSSGCTSCDEGYCGCDCEPWVIVDVDGCTSGCPSGQEKCGCNDGRTQCCNQESGDPDSEDPGPSDPDCVNFAPELRPDFPENNVLLTGDTIFKWEVTSWGQDCDPDNQNWAQLWLRKDGLGEFYIAAHKSLSVAESVLSPELISITYPWDTNLEDDMDFLQIGNTYEWYIKLSTGAQGGTGSSAVRVFETGGKIYGDVYRDDDFPGCEGGYEEAPATGINWTVLCNGVLAQRNLAYSALPDSGSKIADNSNDQNISLFENFLKPFLGFIGGVKGNYLVVKDSLFGVGVLAQAPPPPPPPPQGQCSVYADWDKGEVSISANTPGTFEWSIENDSEVYSGSKSIGLPSVWESDIKSRYWQIQDGGLHTLRAYCKFITPDEGGRGDEEEALEEDYLCPQPAYTCLNPDPLKGDILPYTDGVPYNVTIGNIEDGYESNTCDSNPALEPDSQGATFILSLSYNQWWQVEGGDIHAEGSEITSNIPSTAAFPYLMLNGALADHGVVSQAIGTPDIFEGGIAEEDPWQAESGNYEGKKYNYGFWKDYLSSELTDWGGGSSPVTGVWESTVDGSLDIGVDDWSLGTVEEQQIFILHDGNVSIRGNIEISLGSSLVVVASGNIYIYPNVTRADGYYISDGAISVMGRLEVQGGLTAYGGSGIVMPAVDVDSDDEPVFKFIFRPDIYMNLPEELKVKRIEEWVEIAP